MIQGCVKRPGPLRACTRVAKSLSLLGIGPVHDVSTKTPVVANGGSFGHSFSIEVLLVEVHLMGHIIECPQVTILVGEPSRFTVVSNLGPSADIERTARAAELIGQIPWLAEAAVTEQASAQESGTAAAILTATIWFFAAASGLRAIMAH
jgi:hypothetical protein